jgi:hypothetical protein
MTGYGSSVYGTGIYGDTGAIDIPIPRAARILAVDTGLLDVDIFGAPIPRGAGGGITVEAELWQTDINGNKLNDLSRYLVAGSVDYQYARAGGIAGNPDGSALAAQITLDQPNLVQPLKDYLEPYMLLSFDDGRSPRRIQLGRYAVMRPNESHSETTAEVTYECRDLTSVLNRTFFNPPYHVDIGDNFGTEIKAIMALAGITTTNVRSTSKTAGKVRTFSRRMSLLGGASRLAHAIGWYRIFADLNGDLTTLPYRRSATTKPVATLTDDDPCNVLDVTPAGEVANVVLLTADNPGPGRSFFTRAVNDDETDPLSTVNLGRELVYSGDVITIQDVDSQADLDAIGDSWLEEARSAEVTVTVVVPPTTGFGILRTVDLLFTDPRRVHLAGRYSMRGFSLGFAPRTDSGSFDEAMLTMTLNRLVAYGEGAGEAVAA